MRGRTVIAAAAMLGLSGVALAAPAYAVSTPGQSAGVVTYVVAGGGKGVEPNFGPFTFAGTVVAGGNVYAGTFSGPGGSYNGVILPFPVSGSTAGQTLSGTCSLHDELVVNSPVFIVLGYAMPCSLAINGAPAAPVTLHLVNPLVGVSSPDGSQVTVVNVYTGVDPTTLP